MVAIVRLVNETFSAVGKAARASGSYAQVCTADHATRYLRYGSGHPVLVLDCGVGDGGPDASVVDARDQIVWPELFERLSRGSRVILPDNPIVGPRFAGWLRGFIDGIGLPPLTLIAAGSICVAAMEFALTDPERVQRLILIPAGAAEENWLSAILTPTRSIANIPMLVVRRTHPGDEADDVIERFIAPSHPEER